MKSCNLELLKLISDSAFLKGDFITRAGKKTNYYIDKYLFETKPSILDPLADEIVKQLPPSSEYDRIAAPELGAVSIATAVSLKAQKPFIIVKKEVKDYGTKKLIEGTYQKQERVVVLEDILTTGGAVLRACDILVKEGLQILKIIAVFNREEGADEAIRAKGFSYQALFSRSDLT